MLDFTGIPEELQAAVNNYRIYLCEVRKFENTDVFRTDLKQVFDCVRYSDDPEKLYELVANDPLYREMEGDTYDLIAQYTKTNELMQVKSYGEKEEKVDMCKAITELINRGRMEGMKSGIEQGMKSGIEQGIKQNLMETIANMLIHKVSDGDICTYTRCEPELIDTVRQGMNMPFVQGDGRVPMT